MFVLPGWRRIALLSLPPILGAGLVAGALYLHALTPTRPVAAALPEVAPAGDLPSPAGLLVHVSGAVVNPGLYRLKRGDRVYAAISAAGGLLPTADQAKLPDLAQRLRDGQQVRVPFVKGAGPAGAVSGAKIDLNTASASDLASVPGFTPALAEAVLEYRNRYGPFTATKELVTLIGMSAADFALARKHLTV